MTYEHRDVIRLTDSSRAESTGSDSGMNWSNLLATVGIGLSLILLWVGIKRIELTNPVKAAVSLLDVALLVVGVVYLGWAGAFIAGGISLLGILAHSFRLYVQHDEILTDAAVQGDADKDEIKALAKRLQSLGGAFKVFGPIQTARLINYLSIRARKPSEIEQVAPAIAALWVIFRPDLESLVERFDRLMRQSGEPADRAMHVADVLTAATQKSRATFDEILDGMLAVYDAD